MIKRQQVILLIAAAVNLVLAALCPSLDTPPPGDLRDYYPFATVFLMAPLLASSFTLAIGGFRGFWSGNRRCQLPLLLLGLTIVCYTVIHAGFGAPLLWLNSIYFTGMAYGFCLAELLLVRWVWENSG